MGLYWGLTVFSVLYLLRKTSYDFTQHFPGLSWTFHGLAPCSYSQLRAHIVHLSLGLLFPRCITLICFQWISPAILLPSLSTFKNNLVKLWSALVFTSLTNYFVLLGPFHFNNWSFFRLFTNMGNMFISTVITCI